VLTVTSPGTIALNGTPVVAGVRPLVVLWDGTNAVTTSVLTNHSQSATAGQLALLSNLAYDGTNYTSYDTAYPGAVFRQSNGIGWIWRTAPAGSGSLTLATQMQLTQAGILSVPNNPFVAAYSSTAATTVTAATWTALAFNSEADDSQALHDTSTNPTRITIPTGGAGVYHFDAQIETNGTNLGTVDFGIALRTDGSTYVSKEQRAVPNTAWTTTLHLSCILKLAAGAYVELMYYTSNATAQWVGGAVTNTYLTVAKIQ
jgi:hypothetical protein